MMYLVRNGKKYEIRMIARGCRYSHRGRAHG
jgi:hypothetical protein